MINKKILKIRKDLVIRQSFFKFNKKRTKLVNKVLENKKYKKDIIDKKELKSYSKYS